MGIILLGGGGGALNLNNNNNNNNNTPPPSSKVFFLLRCSKQKNQSGGGVSSSYSSSSFVNKTNYYSSTPLLQQQNLLLMLPENENALFFNQAQSQLLLNSCFVPDINIIADLMYTYCNVGRPHQVQTIINHLLSLRWVVGSDLIPDIYRVALSCLGSRGELQLMEYTLTDMLSTGFPLDSATGNLVTMYYSLYGSVTDMEFAYARLKKSRILLNEEGIRAVSFAYFKRNKFYHLGEFIREVGLGRRDVGNLLWNLLLLSYAANFKMKSLQREFLRMLEAGFLPDITTFNIRALAFSKMSLFWDLHLSLQHMKHEKVVPDLVTYGSVVDAYLDRRLGKNLEFALSLMSVNDSPRVLTDPLVFQVLGKGDFHASSEAFLEFKNRKKWTYKDLIGIYVKKKYRSNQIFWNY